MKEKKREKILMQIPTGATVAEITKAQWPLWDWHNKSRNGRAQLHPKMHWQHWGSGAELLR